jgi:peptidylprolyl isomerase
VVGRVIRGMGYADGIEKGEPPAHPTRIIHAWIGAPPADPATPAVADPVAPAAPKIAVPATLSPGGITPKPAAKPAPKPKK